MKKNYHHGRISSCSNISDDNDGGGVIKMMGVRNDDDAGRCVCVCVHIRMNSFHFMLHNLKKKAGEGMQQVRFF